ncbi:MAG TPA: FAD-binding oxidoreductase [Solirubrobacteraceae bacterium]|nr:FAD-binding oxidoreductase [Solirubrobacteraceae bacterium]
MAHTYAGEELKRGHPGYEEARRGAVWNARTPERFPDTIVLAESDADVIAAVRAAHAANMKIGVRSGGHSWAGNHVRNGGLLLDLSRLNAVEIDAPALTASAQPGCRGDELVAALGDQQLFFPAGHCNGVALGGYLLQGGYGWNGRLHGPACMSVDAIDVVTADGVLVHADAEHNSDLLWAARGSGPGFFGVVTRFHLRVQPQPKVVANGVYLYPIELLDDVFRWAHEIAPRVARTMELMLIIHRDNTGELEIAVTGPVLVDTDEQARAALALLETCPVLDRAKLAVPHAPGTLTDLYAGVQAAYPDNHRYVADNMWTHAPIDELLPGLRRIADTLPEAPSHMLWMNWQPGSTPAPARPDMAYSVEDNTYIALYGVWQDPALDRANVAWATDRMRELEHLATGIQLADENLGQRPARFVSDEHLARLDELRAKYDPHERFHSWMGRPTPRAR